MNYPVPAPPVRPRFRAGTRFVCAWSGPPIVGDEASPTCFRFRDAFAVDGVFDAVTDDIAGEDAGPDGV